MKTDYSKYLIYLVVSLFLVWTISCSGRSGKRSNPESVPVSNIPEENIPKLIKMISPDENTGFKLHEQIKVVLAPVNTGRLPDSVVVYFDGHFVNTVRSAPWECIVPKELTKTTGRKSLKVTAYSKGKPRTTITRFMIIYSDSVPVKNGYKVVNVYPHDRNAFTQGLFYDKGFLYEGTGQETESSLREVDLKTGKVIRQLNLSPSLFGEGITLYNDRIFQVTWTSRVGFVYKESNFELINKIYYQTEGWGLTTINDRIVMSDGTNVLYFYEPETFTVVSRVEVYDNKEKVDSLNELEYINGEIWANVWMTNHIARIDPVSGKVLGYVNLKGILKDPDTDTSVNVLNGIAFDKTHNRIFVTGKNWPELFEIKITE